MLFLGRVNSGRSFAAHESARQRPEPRHPPTGQMEAAGARTATKHLRQTHYAQLTASRRADTNVYARARPIIKHTLN